MKNFKKRLPVLILAFLIAAMPLFSVVPASAASDVLEGVPDASSPSVVSGYLLDGFDVHLELPALYFNGVEVSQLPNIVIFDGPHTNSSGSVAIECYILPSTVVSISEYYNSYGDFNALEFRFSGVSTMYYSSFTSEGWSDWDTWDDSYIIFGSDHAPNRPSFFLHVPSQYTIPSVSYLNSIYVGFASLVISGSSSNRVGGILSVFSGVAFWFAGAISNMTPIFWTADVGLTPIGVLSVCSLALAVILLLFWLIVGFLKFK